ncbi:hypothetical protein [Acidovorax cavernicola]|uniref:hypothetical protein n=1 Tax=Acidovorax cavernicola TaxID=1675792 RepID=UPI00142DB393|nr:hypothetical protein [Acidovorax cavernicola]
MHQFWTDYAKLCDELFELMSVPKLSISAEPSDLYSTFRRSVDFLESTGRLGP